MSVKKQITRLTDMEYDEVSLVGLACNQEADIVLFKSVKTEDEVLAPVIVTRRSNIGKAALVRHAIRKMSPDASDVHEESTVKGKKGLTPAQKKRAKARAAAAGRPYPNAYDNLYEFRKGEDALKDDPKKRKKKKERKDKKSTGDLMLEVSSPASAKA